MISIFELRELVRLRERLLGDFGDRVRQLHRLVDLGFPEFTRYVRSLDSELASAILHDYPTAAAFRGVSVKRLAALRYDGRHQVGAELEWLDAFPNCNANLFCGPRIPAATNPALAYSAASVEGLSDMGEGVFPAYITLAVHQDTLFILYALFSPDRWPADRALTEYVANGFDPERSGDAMLVPRHGVIGDLL